jgi:hypothetical protein
MAGLQFIRSLKRKHLFVQYCTHVRSWRQSNQERSLEMFSIGRLQLHRFSSSVLSLLIFLLFFWTGSAYSAQVTLAWDIDTNLNVTGYRLYYGFISGQYSDSVKVGKNATYNLSKLDDGNTYYIVITAYDRDGNESGFSNEVVYEAPPLCAYSVSPANQSFAPVGGTDTINVTTKSGCSWTAVSNDSWLVVTSNGNASGKDNVNYSALPNSSSSMRTATLNVAGQSVTITQSGMPSYAITGSAGSNGSISPNASVIITSGGNQTFNIMPDAYYQVADVKVDGVSKGPITSYTFSNITSNHSISASFVMTSYAISASAGSNGAISPNGNVTINSGGSRTFIITANQRYQVADVKVDGVSKGPITSYAFSNVTGNHIIEASFSAVPSNGLVIEAENASINTAGGLIKGGWNLWSNGTLGENIYITAAGTYEVVVRAYGSSFGGIWPLMALSADGIVEQPVTVDSIGFTDYLLQVDLTPGFHSIGVAFLNDAYIKGGEDRNLCLDKFTIYSQPGIAKPVLISLLVVIEAENASINATGAAIKGGWNLWSNGILGENIKIPAAGTYEVVVRAYGSPFGGIWPLMALSVDGRLVGQPITVDSSEFKNYLFQVDLTPGIHSIGLAFLNDASNPGVEDRNLYLDKFAIYSPPGS